MSDYHLTEHFQTVQRFFLMEAGDTMLQFYSDIFQRVGGSLPSLLHLFVMCSLCQSCPFKPSSCALCSASYLRAFGMWELCSSLLCSQISILQIQDGQPWQDPSYLNAVLQEVLQNQYPALERRYMRCMCHTWWYPCELK